MHTGKNIVASFYRYFGIENAGEFARSHLEFCISTGLRGRILVGKEGINGSVFGTKEAVEKYKAELCKNPVFSGIKFKEQETDKIAFRKMFVRLRNEIVHFGAEVDLKNTAEFVTPAELKELPEIINKALSCVLIWWTEGVEEAMNRFNNKRKV